jgi:hypothetical protein
MGSSRLHSRAPLLLSLLAVFLVATAQGALAGRTWCYRDPALLIGGREAHINVASYEEMLGAATGPVQLVVTVPSGREGRTQLLSMDDGFGFSYSLTVKKSSTLKHSETTGIEIIVEAYAPARDGGLPVLVELDPITGTWPTRTAKGSANRWITLRGKV